MRIPIVEERLVVGSTPVISDVDVRVRTDTLAEPYEIDLHSEHVDIERRHLDLEVEAPPPATWWDGEVLVIPIVEERLVIQRRLFVREEIRIHRHKQTQRISDVADRRVETAEVERRPRPAQSSPSTSPSEHHMKTIVGTFDDLASARTTESELNNARFDRVHLIENDGATALSGLDIPPNGKDQLRSELQSGRVLLAVRCDDDRVEEARMILERGYTGVSGDNIDRAAYDRAAADRTGQDRDAVVNQTASTTSETVRVPIVEERVAVGKEVVNTGGVRVHTFVAEHPVERTVELREEDVVVERHKVDRPATADDAAFQERTIRVEERAERAVVAKEANVVEEVEIRKEVHTHPETIHETVRRTEVEVEEIDEGNIRPLRSDDRWRRHFDTNYATSGGRWEEWEPGYSLGSEFAKDPRYSDSDWNTVEPLARDRWARSRDIGLWDRIRMAVKHAFESDRDRGRHAGM